MKIKEIVLQKVKNVIRVFGFSLITCLYSVNSQNQLKGTYSSVDGTGDYFSNYEFSEKGLFRFEKGMDLGISTYGKGHYTLKGDSLILNYNASELKTNDYHISNMFINDKDSVTVFIKLYDQDKNVLKNEAVVVLVNNLLKRTDEEGEVTFKFKKEKVPLKLSVASEFLPYEFSIWQNKNYEIEVFVNPHMTGVPIKNQIKRYKILEHTSEKLVLQNKSRTLRLIKKD